MSVVVDCFLRYVAVDTQSMEDQSTYPSTEKQLDLAKLLKEELIALGVEQVCLDSYGYVYGTLPANTKDPGMAVGFLAHMDTSPACSGAGVKPQIVNQYDGRVLKLSQEAAMDPVDFPELLDYVGQDLITTDGTTLLGGDDKAGIAEIMAMLTYFQENPQVPHGKICVAFTPDEEIGHGTDFFSVEKFGTPVAYTVDGGPLGELEYENFNAATAKITIHGTSIHTGSAKWKMKHALLIAMELQSMLPVFESPICTEGYEGFFHLDQMNGEVELAQMKYLIRDHDMGKFRQKKQFLEDAVAFLNQKYIDGTVEIIITDSYYNMKQKIEPHKYLITIAEDTMKELGIAPLVRPIRGGTDGARLSFMGLPCPNLCTGGLYAHGRYEFVSIQAMERTVELLVGIAKRFYLRTSSR